MSCNKNVDIEISAQNREIGKLNQVLEARKPKNLNRVAKSHLCLRGEPKIKIFRNSEFQQ